MSESTLRDQIQHAISENPVILFMKGNPDQPMCGFSARTVAILQSLGKPFAAVAEAIGRLAIRGAPLIGVAAAYGAALDGASPEACETLKAARPTAVNLAWAVDRVRTAADPMAEARSIEAQEEAASDAIAAN